MKYFLKCSKESSRISVETSFSDHSFTLTEGMIRQRKKERILAICVGKIKFTHLDNAVIADELPDAVEDEGKAHAKHN